jgi:mRNA interferase MazF
VRPEPKTGDIWLTALDPTVGSEIRKTRPCVIVSPPEIHDHLRTILIAPMTSGGHGEAFRIPLTFQNKQGLILLDQIRALDKSRLIKKLGVLHPITLERTLKTLQMIFEPAP